MTVTEAQTVIFSEHGRLLGINVSKAKGLYVYHFDSKNCHKGIIIDSN